MKYFDTYVGKQTHEDFLKKVIELPEGIVASLKRLDEALDKLSSDGKDAYGRYCYTDMTTNEKKFALLEEIDALVTHHICEAYKN